MPRIKFGKHALSIAILIVCTQELSSQIYPARFYSTQDGLPSNSIFDITQSIDGKMWFVTSKGIVSYDGQSWLTVENTVRLPHSEHSRIKTLTDGSIWAAGQDNVGLIISYLKEGAWKNLKIPDELEKTPHAFGFEVIYEDSGYLLWISTPSSIYTYSSKSDHWEIIPTVLTINSIRRIGSQTFLCTDQGLFRLVDREVIPFDLDRNLLNDQVLTMAYSNNKVYLLGFDWIGILEDNELTGYWEGLQMKSRPIFNKYSLVVDQRGRIFYNCDSPLQLFDPKKGKSEVIETEDKIENAKSIAIFEDFENNIWVGDHRGLFRFNQLRFSNFNRHFGLVNDEVSAITELKNGKLVLANPGALNFLENNIVTKQMIIPYQDGKTCRVLDMAEGSDETLYLALGPAGLYQFKNERFTQITYTQNRDLDFTSVVNWNGRIYATSRETGIYLVEGNKLLLSTTIPGIRKIGSISDNELVANTKKGAYKISDSDTVLINSGLRDIDNTFCAIKWQGELLIGTLGGLMKVNNRNILQEKFLDIDLSVYSLMKDDRTLWIGTSDGVLKWDGKTLKRYDRSHGLIGSEINRSALIKDSKGKVWIGTELGASAYAENEDLAFNLKPRVSILTIQDGEGNFLDPVTDNQVPYDCNNIGISFIGISFFNEEKISYRYQLEGFDPDWIELSTNNNSIARYTNLESGDYRFVVQSRIEKGNWSDPTTSSFTINIPYYATWWFIVLLFVLVCYTLFGIHRLRFLYLLRQQEQLKTIVRERTEEISLLNDSLELKVDERTKELEDRNQRLSEYAFINAHMLRGPLTKIQSLIILLETSKAQKLESNYLEILKASTEELDEVIMSINSTLRDKREPEIDSDGTGTTSPRTPT